MADTVLVHPNRDKGSSQVTQVISLTPGIGSLWDFTEWWTEPILFQKLKAHLQLFQPAS